MQDFPLATAQAPYYSPRRTSSEDLGLGSSTIAASGMELGKAKHDASGENSARMSFSEVIVIGPAGSNENNTLIQEVGSTDFLNGDAEGSGGEGIVGG